MIRPTAHFYTILHALRTAPPAPAARPWRHAILDRDFGTVDVTGALSVAGAESLVLVVHGLGGCAESPYCRGIAAVAARHGVDSLRLSLRGADRQGEDYYHAGLTGDIHEVLRSRDLARYRRIHIVGYSLGGHLTLRYATECDDPRVRSVAAICAPLDLDVACRHIDGWGRGLYRRYLLRSLREIVAPVTRRRELPIAWQEACRVRTLRAWDDLVVAPRHGFASADDYYRRASVAPHLARVRVPALVVTAAHDPLVAPAAVRPFLDPVLATRSGPPIVHRWVTRGGHVSFPQNLDLGFSGERGLESQVLAWIQEHGL